MKSINFSKILVIVGPTASGKTELSVELARKCNGQILSADSRQIFKFMDIGTAKPTQDERERAVHHFVDQLMPDADFSAGEFGIRGRPLVEKLFNTGFTPIVTGGSGLYIRSLVDGMFEGKYKDMEIRFRLKRRAHLEGLDVLYNELKGVDSISAERIHPNDAKRIIRALEVYQISGRPMSEIQSKEHTKSLFPNSWWGIQWPRETLIKRINTRVDRMIEAGLIREVLKLKEMGYKAHLNALDSVGYKEVYDYLNGKISQDEMIELIKRNTRRFAKKQMTWFRKNKRIQWIPVESETVDWKTVAEQIIRQETLEKREN